MLEGTRQPDDTETTATDPGPPRAATGVAGLDAILGGGLPAGRTYLVQGEPGVGKTTLGMQFLLEGLEIVELHATEESLKTESQYTV